MKTQKSEEEGKQEPMKIDQFTKIACIRLVKNEKEETVSLKKYFFLSSVVSYEEGTQTADFDWEGPTIYIVTHEESFYIAGEVKEFDKKMDEYIDSIRKIEQSYNSSEGA